MIFTKLSHLTIAIVAVPVLGVAAVTLGQEAAPSQVLGDMLTCPNGSTVQSAFTLSGDSFTATGPLVALDSQNVTVTGPSGNVTATLTVNAEVDAGLQPGMPVTVHGQLFDQGTTTVASTVRDACNEATEPPTPTPGPTPALEPTETSTPEADEQENDEANDEDQDHEHATPAVPAIPAVPGEHGGGAVPAIPAIPAVPPHHGGHGDHGDDQEGNDNSGHGGGNKHD
ncbi:MAG TPA: hypothetical protein VLS25_03075 [Dehalococcoidia bacterium]|nr:hypothetical protein [Dehalococcoidia bacterium]